jgi:hypothetical protein
MRYERLWLYGEIIMMLRIIIAAVADITSGLLLKFEALMC